MADSTFELVFVNSTRAGESVPLPAGECFVGRSRSNAIVLDDPLVSRRHVRIVTTGDSVVAEDLESSHGTFLNDKRIRGQISLNNGDILQLGDVKLRFAVAARPDPEDRTSFVDGVGAAPSQSHATEFAQVPSGGETRFMPPLGAPVEDEPDKTRVIGDGETRLMDHGDFKGMRAAGKSPTHRGRILAAAAACAAILAASTVWQFSRDDGIDNRTGIGIYHTDGQSGLSISAPAGWTLTQGSKGASFAFESPIRGSGLPARMDMYVDTDQDYGTTGLQVAFEAYVDTIATRHPEMQLRGRKIMTLNNATGIFYAFASPQRAGKGLFLLSGSRRICAECTCPPVCADLLATVFPAILRTFRFNGPQRYLDFPPPTDAIRRIALANREHLASMSQRNLDAGKDLLKNRELRPENLYLAKCALQGCMTTASALGERPPFYSEAAAQLAEATSALEDAIRNQKLRIVIAEHKRDIEQAYWQSAKLSQMMPDKTSEAYQFAAKRMDFYAKRGEE